MKIATGLHHRRSLRLKHYDYTSPGGYFVTICTHDWDVLFGDVSGDRVLLNTLGEVAVEEWLKTAALRPNVTLDEFVVMPNHLHAIVFLEPPPRPAPAFTAQGSLRGPAAGSIGAVMAGFKGASGKRINTLRGTPGAQVWHRDYYERVIRSEIELDRIRLYVRNNPLRWALDKHNPELRATRGELPLARTEAATLDRHTRLA